LSGFVVAENWHYARLAVQTSRYGVMMEAMTKSWSDERLEERFDRIDQRFDGVDRRFDDVDRRFETVDRRFDRVDGDFREMRGEMNGRFDATQRLIIQIGAGMLVTLIVGFAGVIATIATQL
jgi:hypothetical protein